MAELRTQRGKKAFVGGYVPVEAKRRLRAAAQLRGETVTGLICSIADHAMEVAVLLPSSSKSSQASPAASGDA